MVQGGQGPCQVGQLTRGEGRQVQARHIHQALQEGGAGVMVEGGERPGRVGQGLRVGVRVRVRVGAPWQAGACIVVEAGKKGRSEQPLGSK